jgi:hypothetical protein
MRRRYSLSLLSGEVWQQIRLPEYSDFLQGTDASGEQE